YSSVEYKSTHTGKWDYAKSLALPPKLPLGVIGMTSRTDDANASFTITFYKPVPETYNRLKIFCKKEHNAYDLLVKTGTKNIAVAVDSSSADTLPYYEVSLPPLSDHITIQLQKNNPYENELEFYGMSLETSENRGLIFHNCGVGGAKYESVLYEDLFEKQLPALNPDLVIIDFGTNDYIYEDSIHPDLDSQIVAVIHRVRNAAPQASIILTSTQDMYRKGHNMVCGEQFADLIRGIARQEHCGLFDWYWISGGRTARLKWNEKGYSQPDMIHLSPRGYRLKANLFADAIVSTYHFLELNTTDDSLVFNMDSLKEVQKKLIVVDSLWNSTDTRGKHMVRHTVRKGESLSRIASHYGVSIVQIKKWNHLNGDIIHVGQVLVIYTNQKPKPKPKPKTKPAPPKK
ncbi:MAG TPA: GDSL-type esterase/lipase family protein, partial [Bacteroidia bacterium]|nr:GDSL-type esterase/lipase family protein [Bacteroidia bacterium]